jgi:serine/threonine protein kinase
VRSQHVDHRSDIFSLGAVLYEMISSERAFKGDSAVETMSAILTHDPPLLSGADATIAPPCHSHPALSGEERDRRFQSARDLAFALSRFSGTSSRTLTPVTERPKGSRRSSIRAAAAIALVAVARRHTSAPRRRGRQASDS